MVVSIHGGNPVFRAWRQVTAWPLPPLPTQLAVKAKPAPAPVLSSLTESGPKWGPNCAMMFLYEARARARLIQEHQLQNWDPILA